MIPRRRGQYEELVEPKEVPERAVQLALMGRSARWGFGLVAAVVLLAVSIFPDDESALTGTNSHHKHTIPTLLSVVHPETQDYVWALENELYEHLKQATFSTYDAATDPYREHPVLELPRLQLDQTEINLRDPLTLSWTLGRDHQGESILQEEDVIALYCGNHILQDNTDLYAQTFLDAATIAQARATSQKHNPLHDQNNEWHFPSFSVQRQEMCHFALWQARPNHNNKMGPSYVLLGTSEVLEMKLARTVPTAIHLALGNDPTEMVVQFVAGDKEFVHQDNEGRPVGQYNKEGDSKNTQKASGASHTYTAQDMCEAPANTTEAGKFRSPGMIHVVRLTGLEPNTTYTYKVGLTHGQGITWSETFSFTSAPEVGDPEPFSYLVYGDQGCPSIGWGDGGKWVADWTSREILNPTENKLPVRAIHHFGDLSYARGAAHIWDEWFQMISPFTSKVPLMVAVGNHEYDHLSGGAGKDPSGLESDEGYHPLWGNFGNDSGGECGVPTVSHFTMPNSTNSNGLFWYSFDYGSVHTTVISTEHDLSPGSVQHGWLVADLQSVDRQRTPWVVVEGHRPLYESQMNWEDNAVGIVRRYELDDVLQDNNVDLVLAGHYHSYMRTCDGLYNSKCGSAGSPMHITIGSAGAALTESEMYPNHWTDKLVVDFGYGRITVANSSAMLFEFIKAGDSNETDAGKVKDHVWIRRNRN